MARKQAARRSLALAGNGSPSLYAFRRDAGFQNSYSCSCFLILIMILCDASVFSQDHEHQQDHQQEWPVPTPEMTIHSET